MEICRRPHLLLTAGVDGCIEPMAIDHKAIEKSWLDTEASSFSSPPSGLFLITI